MAETIDTPPLGLDIAPYLAGLDKASAETTKLNAQIAAATQASTAAYGKLADGLGRVVAQNQEAAAANREFAAGVAGLVKEIRDTAAAQEAARRAAAESAAERRKANAEARAAAQAEKAAAKEAAQAAKEAATAERLRAKEAAAANAEASKSGSIFSTIISKITGAKSSGEFFTNLATSAGVAGAAFFAFNSISSRVQQGLADFSALQGVRKTLEAIAGSATLGAIEFQYVKQKSDELGLSLVPTARAYAGLFAAAKEANIPVATTREVFEGVASAAKVLNLSAEDTNGVLLALQQIASKGTVASEELRGQIGERLPGAFGLAAKAVGLTTAELGKQLQAGKVLASDFLPKFAAQLKATYGDATADAAQQVGSNLGRINTFFAESSARIGMLFAPLVALFAQLVTPAKTLTQAAQEASSAYFRQAEAAKNLEQSVSPLLRRYEELSSISGRNAVQQKELDAVIQQLAKTVPGAVTEFDAYGKALGINGEAVRKFIGDQQNLTRYLNREALAKNSGDLRNLLVQQDELRKSINNTVAGPDGLRRRQVAEATSGGTGGGGSFVRTLSQAESDKITRDLTAQLDKVRQDIDANLLNRERLRGRNPLLPADPTPTQLEGLVKKQEDLIKTLKDRQKNATQEKQGNGADFLFGPGGLNKQLEDAQKELDRLLGKVDKTAKAAAEKLAAALRALAAAQEELRTKAAAATTKDADDQALKARLAFEEQLRQIEVVKQKLIERENAVRKAGGRGSRADGVIDGEQEKQLAALRVAALDAYYEELRKITEAREQRLFDLRADSDAKQIEAIDRKYDRLIEADRTGLEHQAIEEARTREQLALKAAQEQRRIDQTASLGRNNILAVGQTFGAGTGVSKIEAARAEQKALLENEKKAAEDSLNNTLNKTGKEAEIERAGLRARLLEIGHGLDAIEFEKAKHKPEDAFFKLIFGENDSEPLRQAFKDVANQFAQTLNEIAATQEQAAQNRVQTSTQLINELSSQLAAEIQLNKEGAASNIAGLQNQINEEKARRKEALEDQRSAAKAKVVLDTLTQASSLATAVAEIFAVTAQLNVIPGVGLAIGAALSAALVGAFVASKVSAFQAANNLGAGFRTGGYTGDKGEGEVAGHVHGQEFVSTAETTRSYRGLLEALHTGRPDKLDWSSPQMLKLLPDPALPTQLRAEKAQASRLQIEHSFAPMKQDFAEMKDRLAGIEASNEQMANQRTAIPVPGGYLIHHPATDSTHYVAVG